MQVRRIMSQGYDGEDVARKMVKVIARGEAINRRGPTGGERVDITHDGYTAVLSLYKDGERQTWLLSGWEDYKKEAPDVSSEGDGSTGITLHGPMRARPEEGAGASDTSKPQPEEKSKSEGAGRKKESVSVMDVTRKVREMFTLRHGLGNIPRGKRRGILGVFNRTTEVVAIPAAHQKVREAGDGQDDPGGGREDLDDSAAQIQAAVYSGELPRAEARSMLIEAGYPEAEVTRRLQAGGWEPRIGGSAPDAGQGGAASRPQTPEFFAPRPAPGVLNEPGRSTLPYPLPAPQRPLPMGGAMTGERPLPMGGKIDPDAPIEMPGRAEKEPEGRADLPEGYTLESGKPFQEATPEDFVLRNGKRAWGYVTEELSGGREDVPVGEVRVQAGNEDWGLTHAKKHEQEMRQKGFAGAEAFFENVFNNRTEIIPRWGKYFEVVEKGEDRSHPSAILKWDSDENFYTLISGFPVKSAYIRKQREKSSSLESTPPTPVPAPASLSPDSPNAVPEGAIRRRYEDDDLDATLPPPEETVKTETPTIQTAAQTEADVRKPEDKGPEPFYNISIPAKSKTHHFAVEKSKYSGQFNILHRDERIDSKGRSRVKFVDIGHYSPYTGEFGGAVAKGSPKTILGKLRGQLLERLGKWKDLEEEPEYDPKPQVQDDSGTEALAGSVELVENDAAPSAPGEAEERSRKRYARLSEVAEIALDLDERQGLGVTMEKVIAEQTDVMDAMHREELGSISFLWGEPGDAPYYMNGSGISHILAKRSAEGMDAEKFLMDMVGVIANGDIVKDYTIRGGRPRINIAKGPITAVLGKVRNGERVTWVVTGWDERVPPLKKPRSDTPGREQGLPDATLSETTPSVTEREQNKASVNSKPQPEEKSKSEDAEEKKEPVSVMDVTRKVREKRNLPPPARAATRIWRSSWRRQHRPRGRRSPAVCGLSWAAFRTQQPRGF